MSDIQQQRKKKRVAKSCIFCRRSHVICDEKRPCSRCIKRDIGHLCTTEEPASYTGSPSQDSGSLSPTSINPPVNSTMTNLLLPQSFVSQNVGSEFSSLNEFLSMLDDPIVAPDNKTANNTQDGASNNATQHIGNSVQNNNQESTSYGQDLAQQQALENISMNTNQHPFPQSQQPLNQPPTAKEQFFLTAADPSTEMNPEDRLKLVINAKLEAGLLKPYDYAKGYTRLQEYMDLNMGENSRQRILKPLGSIRPAFRSIARSLKDVDLVLVEEGFERMLLGYDRVFTSMSMPACLWRRTGEIYRANKEFASLVGCTVDDLRDGRLAIYELMSEESAVNFWEKYGSIAFDKGQKAVLTSCNLRSKDGTQYRNCCFSFTIRRDRYNIPICIVGNFIPIA